MSHQLQTVMSDYTEHPFFKDATLNGFANIGASLGVSEIPALTPGSSYLEARVDRLGCLVNLG
jgi:hypothetical protein